MGWRGEAGAAAPDASQFLRPEYQEWSREVLIGMAVLPPP